MSTVLGAIFVAIGAGLFIVAARHFVRRLAFVRNSAVAEGVVVALREERDGMDAQRTRFPRIRFRTASGREVTFEGGMGLGGSAWHVAQAISVRYRVDRPEIAELNGFVALWGPTMVFALLAIVFISTGIALWSGYIPG